MMKKRVLLVFFVALCFTFLPNLQAFADNPKPGGTLRIGARIPQFNRIDVRYPTTGSMVPALDLIHQPLFGWEKDGLDNLIPVLATGFETKDAKEWIIHLRKGVKFHNGREMTAEDLKANLEWRLNTPKGWRPMTGQIYKRHLKAVEVIDRYTAKIILHNPFGPLLRVATYEFRGIAPPEEVMKSGNKVMFNQSGTGPYKIVEVVPKQKVVLERFEGYWGPRPNVDRIEFLFMRSNEARLVALQKGEIDIAQLFDEAIPSMKKDPNLRYEAVVNTPINHKGYFNVRRWPMSDVRFRTAVLMGADWKNISENAWPYKSGNYCITHLSSTKYFSPENAKLRPSYNPEEAKKLIKQVEKDAGKKIPPIYWLDSTTPACRNAGEMAQIQLKEIGIPINLQLLSHGIWFDKLIRDPKIEWDIGFIGYGAAEAPMRGFDAFVTNSGTAPDGKSLGGYSNPEFDQLILKAEQSSNEEDQIRYYQEAEKILIEDSAALNLFHWRMVIAWNKNVKGVVTHPQASIYPYNSWANMWLDR
jgi:peptide/nickel transport system substrate-binding protein